MLLRHAKAVAPAHADDEAGDHGRDLAERGRREAAALGRILQRDGMQPALAIVSSALRTRRSWELLAPFAAPEPQLVVSDRIYLAKAGELMAVLRETADDVASVMLVGHNPGLHELALHLAQGDRTDSHDEARLAQGLPTCTLVCFEVAGSWDELGPGSASQLVLIRP